MKFNLKRKLMEYKRVLKITKKPSSMEFKSIAKVTAIGIFLIGLIGFAIHMIATFIQGGA